MLIRKIVVGGLEANCYIIGDRQGGKGLILDPGADAQVILAALEESQLEVLYIIATHAHIDHIAALAEVKAATNAPFLLHALDVPFLTNPNLNLSLYMDDVRTFPAPQKLVRDKEKLLLGAITLQVVHTPGHTPGSISVQADECIFTGDTLFAGGVGRVDLPGGDFTVLRCSIQDQIFTLPEATKVFPGHGLETFVGKEKRENPFV